MPECTYSPAWATLSYGMTYNQAYTFDVVWSRSSVSSTSADNSSRSSSLMSIRAGLLSLFGILCAYS